MKPGAMNRTLMIACAMIPLAAGAQKPVLREVASLPGVEVWDNHKGDQLAIGRETGLGTSQSHDLAIVPVSGGPERVVAHYDLSLSYVDWTADGRYLYTHLPATAAAGSVVQRVPIDGGKPETLFSVPAAPGRRAAYDGEFTLFSAAAGDAALGHSSYRGPAGETGQFGLPAGTWGRIDRSAARSSTSLSPPALQHRSAASTWRLASLSHEVRNVLTSIRVDLQRADEKLRVDAGLRSRASRSAISPRHRRCGEHHERNQDGGKGPSSLVPESFAATCRNTASCSCRIMSRLPAPAAPAPGTGTVHWPASSGAESRTPARTTGDSPRGWPRTAPVTSPR